jgi:hypothetical protein
MRSSRCPANAAQGQQAEAGRELEQPEQAGPGFERVAEQAEADAGVEPEAQIEEGRELDQLGRVQHDLQHQPFAGLIETGGRERDGNGKA